MIIAKVVLDKVNYNIDKQYDYIIPDNFPKTNLEGCRVAIPFGKYNSIKIGLITEVYDKDVSINLKEINSLIDTKPILNEELLKLVFWLKENTFCTYFEAIKTIIPVGLNVNLTEYVSINNEKNVFNEQEVIVLRKINEFNNNVKLDVLCEKLGISKSGKLIKNMIFNDAIKINLKPEQTIQDFTLKTVTININEKPEKLTAKQKELYNYLKINNSATFVDIAQELSISPVTIKSLEKKGLVTIDDTPYFRKPNNSLTKFKKVVLTNEQNEVYKGLLKELKNNKPSCSLLYGITGSGKTSVFLKLVDDVVNSGKTAIVMVPEIALTPQTISLFYSRYKDEVAVFHSGLSFGERMDEFKRTATGKVKVAIGTRSAVFAPLKNIGIIIIDEEQEHTYKSEQSPRFHAREVAKVRAIYNNCMLLLASATPSFESYSKALAGKYSLYQLNKRYGKSVLPEVITVDEREEIKKGNNGILSELLVNELENTLNKKKQAIFLLNRRGHNTFVSCPSCGYVFNCDNCSISLTYHSHNSKLSCHYCGANYKVPSTCPSCNNTHIKFSGYGTQKAYEELSLIFPNARILRLDADTTTKKESAKKALEAFNRHEYDILIGTQMVAKGLNFPNVTLVGVLCADNAIFFNDFKAYENAFSMLTQVVGRSGRGDYPGKAVIQTSNPENYVIKLASEQNYPAFYNKEIQVRKLLIYPPYCDIVLLGFVSDNKNLSKNSANLALNIIKENVKNNPDIKLIVLGPTAASVPVVANKYRYRLILKTKNNKKFRKFLNSILMEFYKKENKCNIFVDINPENII